MKMPKVGKQRAIQPLCQQRKYGERTMSTLEEITIEQSDRVLCVAAHPDDLEYGVSAAVAKWVEQGVDVTYLLLTTGEAGIQDKSPEETGPLRAQEQKRACAKVGVDDLRILDFSDGVLEYSIELRKKIAEVIRDVKPTVLVLTEWGLEVPWGLNHADHRVAGLAAVDAVRDAGNKWLFTDLTDENGAQLDYWQVSTLLVSGSDRPTHQIEITGEPIEKGIESLREHRVYLENLGDHPDPSDLLRGMTELETDADEEQRYALAVRRFDL